MTSGGRWTYELRVRKDPWWLAWLADGDAHRVVARRGSGRWRTVRTFSNGQEARLCEARLQRWLDEQFAEPPWHDLRHTAHHPPMPPTDL